MHMYASLVHLFSEGCSAVMHGRGDASESGRSSISQVAAIASIAVVGQRSVRGNLPNQMRFHDNLDFGTFQS